MSARVMYYKLNLSFESLQRCKVLFSDFAVGWNSMTKQ